MTPNPKPAPESGEHDPLALRLTGRASFLRTHGQVKSSDLMDEAAVRIASLTSELEKVRHEAELYRIADLEMIGVKEAQLEEVTSELAAVKKRLESAEEALRQIAAHRITNVTGGLDGSSKASLRVDLRLVQNVARTFLQEQEKQNG